MQERVFFGSLQGFKAGSRSIQRVATSKPLRGLQGIALSGEILASGVKRSPFRHVASALGRPLAAGLNWRDGWAFRPGKLSFSSAPVRMLAHGARLRRTVDPRRDLDFCFSILVPALRLSLTAQANR